jgi:aspartate/methionine/tyrosine aminotransferase
LFLEEAQEPVYVSRRVQTTATPIIDHLEAVAAAQRAAGRAVISLGQGVAAFPPPPAALKAARAALADPATHTYSPDAGLPALRAAIARKWHRDAGIAVDPEREIIVTAGGNQAIALALLTCTDPGDTVVLPSPYYFNHEMTAHLCGLTSVEAPLSPDDGFQLTWERLAPHITPATRAVVLTTPSNPTGAVADPAALVACARELAARNVTIIVDETYEYFVFGAARHYSLAADPALRPHVVTVGSFSKSFGMAGWRVGYLFAPPEVAGPALKVHDTLVICAPVIGQRAVAAALDSDYYPLLAAQRAELATRRAALATGLAAIPQLHWQETFGSIFAFVRVLDGPPVAELAPLLIREAGVLTIPGTAFGAAGARHLRLSYGSAPVPVLDEALARLSAFFAHR